MVNKIQLLIIIALVLLTQMSCDKNPADVGLKYDYSLYAYLMIGEKIDAENPVRIKRIFNPDLQFNEQDIAVTDAVVKISKGDDVFNLLHLSNGDYVSEQDDFVIEAETEYVINIDINGYLITAKTVSPKNTYFENEVMSTDSALLPEVAFTAMRNYPIKISAVLGEEIICYMETYCLEDYQNAKYIYSIFGTDYPKDEEEYERPGSGFPRRLSVVSINAPQESIDPNYIVVNDYDSMFLFYGKYRLSVFVIDDNYYSYIYKTKGWEKGGVENAYGVFGAGVKQKFYFTITEG